MWNDGTCTRKEAGPTAGDLVPGSRQVEKKIKIDNFITLVSVLGPRVNTDGI